MRSAGSEQLSPGPGIFLFMLLFYFTISYFILLSRYRDNFEPIQEALWSDVYLLLWAAERECMRRGDWVYSVREDPSGWRL